MEWYTIVGLVVQSTIWVVILLFLSIWVSVNLYESCCCCLRRRSRLLPWAAVGAGSSTASGLGPPEIEKLPTFTYPKVEGDASVKMSRGITECAVCLAAFKEAETLRLIPVCGHVFHADCVDVWLHSHSTCPCCRASLRAEPEVQTGNVELSPV